MVRQTRSTSFFSAKKFSIWLSIQSMVSIQYIAVLILNLIIGSYGYCGAAMRSAWRGSQVFTEAYKSCCLKAGNPFSTTAGPIGDCLRKSVRDNFRLEMSELCSDCFQSAFQCVMSNCRRNCLIPGLKTCFTCTSQHCNPNLMRCTGVISEKDLPPPPPQ